MKTCAKICGTILTIVGIIFCVVMLIGIMETQDVSVFLWLIGIGFSTFIIYTIFFSISEILENQEKIKDVDGRILYYLERQRDLERQKEQLEKKEACDKEVDKEKDANRE